MFMFCQCFYILPIKPLSLMGQQAGTYLNMYARALTHFLYDNSEIFPWSSKVNCASLLMKQRTWLINQSIQKWEKKKKAFSVEVCPTGATQGMDTAGVNTDKFILIKYLQQRCTFYLQIFSPLLSVLLVWAFPVSLQ